jgi:hypothetical protein
MWFIAYVYGKTSSRWEKLGKRSIDTIALTHVKFVGSKHSNGV